MRLHRFIGDYDIAKKVIRVEAPEFLNQIINVLRLRVGDSLILVQRGVGEAQCLINQLNDSFAEFEVTERLASQKESVRHVTLYCSVLKRENFEFVVQKATEAGVARIVPILAARTVKLNINEDRLVKIAREAAEQSGRITIPEISSAMSLRVALAEATAHKEQIVFFDGTGQQFHMSKFMPETSVAIFIGPEGGWDESELSAAADTGASVLNLGALTLRAETAATVSTYLLCQLKSD